MNRKDLIELGEIVIKKFEGVEDLKEELERTKENNRRLRLLSPVELAKELPRAKANEAKRIFRKLGINFTEILPDVSLTSY